MLEGRHTNKYIYEKLLDRPKEIVFAVAKWKNEIPNITQEFYSKVVRNRIVGIEKYDSFQYKLCNKAVLLNDRLVHMKVKLSDRCDFCQQYKEIYNHFFFECEITQEIIQQLIEFIKLETISNVQFNYENIIFNNFGRENSFISILMTIFKQKLYAAKCLNKKPKYHEIKYEYKFIKEMEERKINSSKSLKKFNQRWDEKITM